MSIKFKKVSEFKRGTLFELLTDAYSYDCRNQQCWGMDWRDFDDFFFDNLKIADKYGFVTTFNNNAVGFISWDPRNMPEYAEIGHNCISVKYKRHGYGKIQLQEAVDRIVQYDLKKIIVTTNEKFIPAQRMYESIGFKVYRRKNNRGNSYFTGDYIDYEYLV